MSGNVATTDIASVLAEFACKRPVFHSEADFQHALAWEIHARCPTCSMRLELKPPRLASRMHIDIWAADRESILALELKYKTRGLRTTVEGEPFDLTNQSAQDCGRYDFLKDVQRLEGVVSQLDGITAYALLLTNDSAYWTSPSSNATCDASFRLHENRTASGELRWEARTSPGTMRGREDPIIIRGAYRLLWQDYSQPTTASRGKFRYLLVKVDEGRGIDAGNGGK